MKPFKLLVFSGIAILGIFLLIEGLSSLLYAVKQVASLEFAEQTYAEYDPELGWISKPDQHIKDMFGPGRDLDTNHQRLRATCEYSIKVPENRVRIICSGDSFTFGYGVGNSESWCARLSQFEPRFEVLNMGLGAYGIDQSFLRYQRDGLGFEHDIHIFAFITTDFYRMQGERFLNYGKPRLEIKNGILEKCNVPVPLYNDPVQKAGRPCNWRDTGWEILRRLHSMRFLRGLLGSRPIRTSGAPEDKSALSKGETARVVLEVFSELQKLARARRVTLVLLYLPTEFDYWNKNSDSWRLFLSRKAHEHGWHFIDLVSDIRKLSPQDIRGLFIRRTALEEMHYAAAAGHYNEAGNRFIARALLAHLEKIPEIRARLLAPRAS